MRTSVRPQMLKLLFREKPELPGGRGPSLSVMPLFVANGAKHVKSGQRVVPRRGSLRVVRVVDLEPISGAAIVAAEVVRQKNFHSEFCPSTVLQHKFVCVRHVFSRKFNVSRRAQCMTMESFARRAISLTKELLSHRRKVREVALRAITCRWIPVDPSKHHRTGVDLEQITEKMSAERTV